MYRNVINDLAAWFEEKRRRILYVKGAYGVGKTWSIRDFATAFFDNQKYIDCSQGTAFRSTISGISSGKSGSDDTADSVIISAEEMNDKSIESRIADMDFLLEQHFENNDFAGTLLIFDEVQDIPGCAEFFYEFSKKHRDYTICLIASSMEITEYEYHHPDVFNIIRMRPMSFEEYMIANKAHPFMAAIENHKHTPLTQLEENAISSMLREYMLVGGMPGIVKEFLKDRDYTVVRPMQEDLISSYEKLIKKHTTPAMAQRCRRIWKSIPKQLTRDNKKFMYRFVETNARGREYSEAAQILCNLGVARKLPRLSKGEIPLEDNVDYKSFELFYIDHGLLRASFNLPINEDIPLSQLFSEENGAVAEQFIFEELSSKVGYLYYWVSGATARVPFVYEGEQAPVPVDVRFVDNKKAQNIKVFREKNPNTEISIKISLEQVSLTDKVLNIPAYGLWNM